MNTGNDRQHRIRLLTVTALALISTLTLTACGDGSDTQSDAEKADHVWKDKTQAIDKARDVQRQLDQSRK